MFIFPQYILVRKYLWFNILLFILLFQFQLFILQFWLWPFIIGYAIIIILIYKSKIFIIPIIFFISFGLNFDNYLKPNEKYNHIATVEKVYSSSITVLEDGQKYYIMQVDSNLAKGDVVSYNTKYYNELQKDDFYIFYKSTEAIGYGYGNNIEVISRKESLRGNIYYSLLNRDSKYSDFALLMLYGTSNERNSNLENNINKMGISHLFVVSGFHISLFYIGIEKIGKKFIKNKRMLSFASFSSVLFFLYLVYFPPTGIRALLTLLIIRTYRFNKIDSLSIVGIIFYIFNPWIMLTSSMVLSFSITGMIYFLNPNSFSFRDSVLLSILAFYLAIPTITTWDNNFNLLSPLLTIVMTPIVSLSYIICLFLLPFNSFWFIGDWIFFLIGLIIQIFSILYIGFDIQQININKQFFLTGITLTYIVALKNNKAVLLNVFFILSLIFFII